MWFIRGYWNSSPVLYSRTLLLIHSICNSLHFTSPNSLSLRLDHKSVLCVCEFASFCRCVHLYQILESTCEWYHIIPHLINHQVLPILHSRNLLPPALLHLLCLPWAVATPSPWPPCFYFLGLQPILHMQVRVALYTQSCPNLIWQLSCLKVLVGFSLSVG